MIAWFPTVKQIFTLSKKSLKKLCVKRYLQLTLYPSSHVSQSGLANPHLLFCVKWFIGDSCCSLTFLSIFPWVLPNNRLSVYPPLQLFIYLPIHPFIYLSVCLCICSLIYSLFVCLSLTFPHSFFPGFSFYFIQYHYFFVDKCVYISVSARYFI